MEPRLKGVVWERTDDELMLVYDVRDHFVLSDPDGSVEELLTLLREGGRSTAGLVAAMRAAGHPVSAEDVGAALDLFDSYRLLEDGRRNKRYDAESQERYFSNLAFFESFSTLSRSRQDLQQRLTDSHVLVLGTGGINSSTIPHLCGMGVGRLTLLDRDVVETRNFARQYLYRYSDIGSRKVQAAYEWVREFDPSIKVEAIDTGIGSAADVGELIDSTHPDIVMSGVDSPAGVDNWVNEGCVPRGVPFVRAGMRVTQGTVWSVDAGVSACLACQQPDTGNDDPEALQERQAIELYNAASAPNRAIGPVAGVLGSLAAFEVLRYLTRFEPPAYSARPALVDFAAGCAVDLGDAWYRDPTCAVCGSRQRV